MLIFAVWVLFRSGAEHIYKKAATFEWHNGAFLFIGKEIPITDKWLILLDKNGNQIKCFDHKDVQDVGYDD